METTDRKSRFRLRLIAKISLSRSPPTRLTFPPTCGRKAAAALPALIDRRRRLCDQGNQEEVWCHVIRSGFILRWEDPVRRDSMTGWGTLETRFRDDA